MGNSMKKLPDGSYKWIGADWWKRLMGQRGGGRRLNVVLVKIASTHNLHYSHAVQFVEYLIRLGDHEAAWAATKPRVNHRVGVKALHITDAKNAIRAIGAVEERRSTRYLNAIREIINEEPPERAVDLIRSLIGNGEDEPVEPSKA